MIYFLTSEDGGLYPPLARNYTDHINLRQPWVGLDIPTSQKSLEVLDVEF